MLLLHFKESDCDALQGDRQTSAEPLDSSAECPLLGVLNQVSQTGASHSFLRALLGREEHALFVWLGTL